MDTFTVPKMSEMLIYSVALTWTLIKEQGSDIEDTGTFFAFLHVDIACRPVVPKLGSGDP